MLYQYLFRSKIFLGANHLSKVRHVFPYPLINSLIMESERMYGPPRLKGVRVQYSNEC